MSRINLQSRVTLYCMTVLLAACKSSNPDVESSACVSSTSSLSSSGNVENVTLPDVISLGGFIRTDFKEGKDAQCNVRYQIDLAKQEVHVFTARHCLEPRPYKQIYAEFYKGSFQNTDENYFTAPISIPIVEDWIKITEVADKYDMKEIYDLLQGKTNYQPIANLGALYDRNLQGVDIDLFRKMQNEQIAFGSFLCGGFYNPAVNKVEHKMGLQKVCMTYGDMFYTVGKIEVTNDLLAALKQVKKEAILEPINLDHEFVKLLEERSFGERNHVLAFIKESFDNCKYSDPPGYCGQKTDILAELNKISIDHDSKLVDDDGYSEFRQKQPYKMYQYWNSLYPKMLAKPDSVEIHSNFITFDESTRKVVSNFDRKKLTDIQTGNALLFMPYGLVGFYQEFKVNHLKGASGTMITFEGVPLLVMATVDNENSSSGILYEIPEARRDSTSLPDDDEITDVGGSNDSLVAESDSLEETPERPEIAAKDTLSDRSTNSNVASDETPSEDQNTSNKVRSEVRRNSSNSSNPQIQASDSTNPCG